jgi:hypothetical protein
LIISTMTVWDSGLRRLRAWMYSPRKMNEPCTNGARMKPMPNSTIGGQADQKPAGARPWNSGHSPTTRRGEDAQQAAPHHARPGQGHHLLRAGQQFEVRLQARIIGGVGLDGQEEDVADGVDERAQHGRQARELDEGKGGAQHARPP